MKAIITGGGIAGLAAARGLQLLNYEVTVYEQAPELKPVGAGIVLSANALRALGALGLYEEVAAKGHILERFNMLDDKGNLLAATNHFLLSKKFSHISSLTLHRAELQEALLSFLPPGIVQTGKRCKNILQTEGYAEVEFTDGEVVQADIIIGCDGIHSAVRDAIFPGSEKRFAGYTCWRGITGSLPASLIANYATESLGRGKRFGIVPLSNNRIYWYACLNTKGPHDPEPGKFNLNDLQELFSAFHEPVQEILKSTPPEVLFLNDITDLKPIPCFSKGRVVLLGDAAHATTPNMGQGACQALEDVAVITHLLQENGYKKAFQEFNRLRVPRTHKIVNQSWQLGKLTQWENPVAVRFRNLLMKNIPAKVNERQMDELLNVHFKSVTKPSAALV